MKIVSQAEYDAQVKKLRANYEITRDGNLFGVIEAHRCILTPWRKKWKHLRQNALLGYSANGTISRERGEEIIQEEIAAKMRKLGWHMLAEKQSCA